MKEKLEDQTNALSQAPLNYDEEFHINLPHILYIKLEGQYVTFLNSALYGMVKFPKWWFDMLYMDIK